MKSHAIGSVVLVDDVTDKLPPVMPQRGKHFRQGWNIAGTTPALDSLAINIQKVDLLGDPPTLVVKPDVLVLKSFHGHDLAEWLNAQ
jgi:hypothetical protein